MEKTDSIKARYTGRQIHKLLEDCRFGKDYELWKKSRFFITKALNKRGTFLDIGCANGFLLKCLMAWSKHQIIPYGIDNRPGAIKKARMLFPDQADHFGTISGDNLNALSNTDFPKAFDFVYRNYWRDEPKDSALMEKIVAELLTYVKPGGRLLLGVYFGNADRNGRADQLRQQQKFRDFINQCKKGIPRFDGEAYSKENQWICWIEKKIGSPASRRTDPPSQYGK